MYGTLSLVHFFKRTSLTLQLTGSIVMDCWKNSRLKGSGMRALSILNEMIGSEADGALPDTISYNTVFAALAQSGNLEKIEALIESMHNADNQKQAMGERSLVKPNLITYNSLMAACMKSRSPGALEKAQETLEKMHQLYSSGILDAKPDFISFNSLLWCWAYSTKIDAGERCEEILEEMLAKSRAGEKDMKPNLSSYGAVIRAWLSCNEAEQAKRVVLKMCDDYENGDQTMKPSVDHFRSILKDLKDLANEGSDQIRQRMRHIHPQLLDLEMSSTQPANLDNM